MTPPITPNGIAWLTDILTRRLCVGVSLEIQQDAWILRAKGMAGGVRFPRLFTDIGPGQAPATCTRISITDLGIPLGDLVAPGLSTPTKVLTSHIGADLHVAYDVPGLIFWALLRQEELGRHTMLDAHGRFPASASHAAQHGYLDRPVVDEWITALHAVIQTHWPQIPPLPHAAEATQMSHDVDTPTRYGFTTPRQLVRRMAGDVRRGLPLWDVLRAPAIRHQAHTSLHPADPANRFDWIMGLSEASNIASTFYFITSPHPNAIDPRYPFDSPALHDLLRRIHGRGHQIGLHPGYNSFTSPAQITAEADHLRRVCAALDIPLHQPGARMHYLQWSASSTPAALDDAGMTHDATLGYADRPGFRAGTCHPYPWFDTAQDTTLKIQMQPLIAMEQSLVSPANMGLSPKAAIAALASLKATCQQVGGTFSMLWHNDMFSTKDLRKIYAQTIRTGSE